LADARLGGQDHGSADSSVADLDGTSNGLIWRPDFRSGENGRQVRELCLADPSGDEISRVGRAVIEAVAMDIVTDAETLAVAVVR
jgi:hypothetical protein